jgi:hypothetical protein
MKYRHIFIIKIIQFNAGIERQKGNWHEHILRLTTKRFPKILINYKPRGH